MYELENRIEENKIEENGTMLKLRELAIKSNKSEQSVLIKLTDIDDFHFKIIAIRGEFPKK